MTWICVSVLLAAAVGPVTAKPPVDFVRDVQPLFSTTCTKCHGPEKRKGGLRLDVKDSVMAGGATGPALQAGKGAASLLVQRLRGEGDEERMPPEGPPLSTEQIKLLERWIDEGAVWPASATDAPAEASANIHWAYRPPSPPKISKARPQTKFEAINNDLDQLVVAKLHAEGLTLSPPAARETLLRRASLDLIGLPPTLAEVAAFVKDGRPDAWARQVDRLLASPHYGERWARMWLDLARYADSNGYEKDRPRVAWKYRDWVINAFNTNMSFKQFTIEQLAGDMLPNPTIPQQIATGFHRNTMINQEGGVDPQEAYYEVLVDRVGTTASVWLGSTLACAQCHNHKFDPFSQKDFYKFMAFFSNVEAAPRGGLFDSLHMGETILSLPNPSQEKERVRLESELAAVQAEIALDTPALRAAQTIWETQQRAADSVWQPLAIKSVTSAGGAQMKRLADGSVLASGTQGPGDVYSVVAETTAAKITGIRLEVLGDKSLPHGGPGRGADGGFLLTGFDLTQTSTKGSPQPAPVVFSAAAADETRAGIGPESLLRETPEGWAIDVDAAGPDARRQAVFVVRDPFGDPNGTTLLLRMKHVPRALRGIGRFKLSVTTAPDPLFITQVPRQDRGTLRVMPEKRTPAQLERLVALHRDKSPFFKAQRARRDALRKQKDALGIVTAMTFKERQSFERPSALMRARGSFMAPGERVYADVPKFLPPLPADSSPNRLGLARWLVDDANPLTARVTVNRLWEQLFGRGLVEASEDFGTQSAAPSHPELLDWLATTFMSTGWDMKALLRTIMMSGTYQQSSVASPTLRERDPGNHLFARGPRFRVEGETLRDIALSTSGLLSKTLGGPSVFPWQPAGIWEVPYNEEAAVWKTSAGEDKYRRTLYTYLRRSAPYPFLINFDGTSRESCTLRRSRTNTPLQVLNTLNDPVFFHAAQTLGSRMKSEGGKGPAEWVGYGFRLATSRLPSHSERKALQTLFETQRRQLSLQPNRIAQLLRDPTASEDEPQKPAVAGDVDQAALTLVANVLLSLDETLTKE